MRPKRLASAALAALIAVLAVACSDTLVRANQLVIIGEATVPTPSGNCVITISVSSATSGVTAQNNTVQMMPGQEMISTAGAVGSPASCVTENEFDWSSFNESVATVTKNTSVTATIRAISSGLAQICATHRQTGVRFCFWVNVGNVTVPTVTVGPSGAFISTGNGCVRTLQMTVSPAGTTGTWSVSGIAGASISSSGLLTVPQNISGTAVATFVTTSGASDSENVVINTADCVAPPSVTISFSVPSICFSTIAGSPTTAMFTVNVAGATNPSVSVTSSNNSFVGISPSGSQVGNTTTWTASIVNPIPATGTVRASSNGVIQTIQWEIRNTACPGASSSIIYTPGATSGAVNTTAPLQATCLLNGSPCPTKPFWDSSDPSRVAVNGTEDEPHAGFVWKVGNTAILTRIAVGSAQICVQPGVTVTSPRYCGSGGNSHVVTP